MKKYVIIALVAVATMQVNAMEQMVEQYVNPGKILNYIYNSASKIPTNMSAEQVANAAGDLFQTQLENMPNQLFGINLAQIRNTLLKGETEFTRNDVLKNIKEKLDTFLPQAKKAVNLTGVVLSAQFFNETLKALHDVAIPMIRKKNTALADELKKLIELLQNNPQVDALVAKASVYIKDLKTNLAQLNVTKDTTLEEIQSQLENLVSQNNVNAMVQAVKNLVSQHKNEIKEILTEIKNIDINQVSEVVRYLQSNI